MSKAWDDQYNSGVEEGIKKGMQKIAIDLYKEGTIDIITAAEECNMSEEEFLKLVNES